eukprot:XP_001710321.1 Hypothetical protein GL50803_24891 [Giardia lamblia ATCC 50803]
MGSCRTKSTDAIYLQNLVIWAPTSQFWQTTPCSYTIRSDHVLLFPEPFSMTIFILTRRAVLSCKVVLLRAGCMAIQLFLILSQFSLQQSPSDNAVRLESLTRCLTNMSLFCIRSAPSWPTLSP